MKTDLLRHTEIFIFLALVFSIFIAVLLTDNANLSEKGSEIGVDRDRLKDSSEARKGRLDSLGRKMDSMLVIEAAYKDSLIGFRNNTPPHIEIDGTENYYFESGKSFIVKEFEHFLKSIVVPKLVGDLANCKGCNALYIVGHTDNNPVSDKNAYFDDNIVEKLNGRGNSSFLNNSNTDLGLQRAVSICVFLKGQAGLDQIEYWFPYSAGPLIDAESSLLTTNLYTDKGNYDKKKRRIEIWLYAYNNKSNNLSKTVEENPKK